MVENNTIVLQWILVVVVFLAGISLFCQGHAILHGKYGYKHAGREKKRAENVRKQMEEIINANGRSTKED